MWERGFLRLAFWIFASAALLQAGAPQDEWTIEKSSGNAIGQYSGGFAKWKIQNKTIDQVYTAFMQSLAQIRDTKAEGDKDSGTITAKRTGSLIHLILVYKEAENAVDVEGRWEFVPGEKMQLSTPFSQAKKFFNDLFPKVKEALNKISGS